MFEFSRGGIDYTIEILPTMGEDGWLSCWYMVGEERKHRWNQDMWDLPNTYGGDEVRFLEKFLETLNIKLDQAHQDGDLNDPDPAVRLKYRIANQLSFDGKHVIFTPNDSN